MMTGAFSELEDLYIVEPDEKLLNAGLNSFSEKGAKFKVKQGYCTVITFLKVKQDYYLTCLCG